MQASDDLSILCPHAGETDRLGNVLAASLAAGDLVTLSGPLGAGKSHLARAVIRARLKDPMAQVPSPSYTLVNIYQAHGVEIWHADLYRLSDSSELGEIGLEDAVASAIVLVEWPERWPELPERRLDIRLDPVSAEARRLAITAHGNGWDHYMAKVRDFSA